MQQVPSEGVSSQSIAEQYTNCQNAIAWMDLVVEVCSHDLLNTAIARKLGLERVMRSIVSAAEDTIKSSSGAHLDQDRLIAAALIEFKTDDFRKYLMAKLGMM